MADSRLYFHTQPLLPVDNHIQAPHALSSHRADKASFASVLAAEKQKVSFSQHAMARLQERKLAFSQQDLTKLDATVERMAEKGARESLIYLNNVALVVSVTSRKVITAMDGVSARENIFTNIDSAAII